MNGIFNSVVALVFSPVKLVADIASAAINGIGDVATSAANVVESVSEAIDEIGS